MSEESRGHFRGDARAIRDLIEKYQQAPRVSKEPGNWCRRPAV